MKNANFVLTALTCITIATLTSAQEKTPPVKVSPSPTEQQQDSAFYACPMHQDITSDKPGTCSKCSMPLEKKVLSRTQPKNPKMEGVKSYTCATHSDVKSDKPGKCTKCGMDLIIDEKGK